MKHSDQILLGALLFLSSVWVAACTISSKSVECTRSKGTVCVIKMLPPSPNSSGQTAVQFPDLYKRTALHILEGTLSILTESMASELNVPILWMEKLGLKSVFVSPNFEQLHLQSNQLTTLQSKSSSSSSSIFALKVLDVRKNQLKNASELEPFVALEELYLDGNQFEQLNMDLFAKMHNLRVLSAAGNGLVRMIPSIDMLVLNNLVTLSLGHNRLSSIQMDNWQIPSLQTLLLSNNSLAELPGMEGFEQFYDLNKLELAGNRWSCGWLQHALANVTVRKLQNDTEGVTLDADTKCSIEKVHDICCSFTPTVDQREEEHLFLPEIGQFRGAIAEIDHRHEAFLRHKSVKLAELQEALQRCLDNLEAFLTTQDSESESAKVLATKMLQEASQLSERYGEMSSETRAAESIEKERKQLLHFMVDMKNRLLQQAIETDRLWAQANAEKANIERLVEERPES